VFSARGNIRKMKKIPNLNLGQADCEFQSSCLICTMLFVAYDVGVYGYLLATIIGSQIEMSD